MVKPNQQVARIMFIIRSLDYGGAERQLIELVSGLDKKRFAITVVTFYKGGKLLAQLEKVPTVQIVTLDKKGRWDTVAFFWQLWQVTRKIKPDIIHGYMDMPNLLSLVYGKLVKAKIVWGLRASNVATNHYDWLEKVILQATVFLSRFTDLIIANSEIGKQDYIKLGYAAKQLQVVHNGIDIEKFYPLLTGKTALRQEWAMPTNCKIIGMVGRINPQKDYPTFLGAAAKLSQLYPDVRFVCVGEGSASYTTELQTLAEKLGLTGKLVWAGGRSDMLQVYNALDILTLSSAYGEGFPNVVGEAMACGTPVIVTDVGDAALIVADSTRVVPPKNEAALLAAWQALLKVQETERQKIADQLRDRIVLNYTVPHLVARTSAALEDLLV